MSYFYIFVNDENEKPMLIIADNVKVVNGSRARSSCYGNGLDNPPEGTTIEDGVYRWSCGDELTKEELKEYWNDIEDQIYSQLAL